MELIKELKSNFVYQIIKKYILYSIMSKRINNKTENKLKLLVVLAQVLEISWIGECLASKCFEFIGAWT